MECFNHQNKSAIGICKHCQKAICHECCELVKGVCACTETCIEKVSKQEDFLQLSFQSIKKTGKAYNYYGHFYVICGFLFTAFGLLPLIVNKSYGAIVLVPLGIAFFIGAYWSYKTGRSIQTNEDNETQDS